MPGRITFLEGNLQLIGVEYPWQEEEALGGNRLRSFISIPIDGLQKLTHVGRTSVGDGTESLRSLDDEEFRILVRFRNGQEITCFLPVDATVGDLHTMAVKRSCSFGFPCTMKDTAIGTCGGYEEFFFSEDPIIKVKPFIYNEEMVELKDILRPS